MQITINQFKTIVPGCKDPETWTNLINQYCQEYQIDTRERLAFFIAQCAHESGSFNTLYENLNYSADALQRVFGKYFPNAQLANEYARKPEKIANRVYANRMGNGDERSGDGWKYRGKGLIQLTGKSNHEAFAKWALLSGIDQSTLNDEKKYAILSAIWFWKTNNLNAYADKRDVTGVTKRINGGTNGLEDRKNYTDRALATL